MSAALNRASKARFFKTNPEDGAGDECEHSWSPTLTHVAWRRITMKTFVTISGGILLTLSCVATSARPHANREGPTQSEPSYYDPDYDSQRNTRNWDNSCVHSVHAAYWCDSSDLPSRSSR
jgi:hypothetical protein